MALNVGNGVARHQSGSQVNGSRAVKRDTLCGLPIDRNNLGDATQTNLFHAGLLCDNSVPIK
jgi:hypothetical protein